jgi:hypothetical protein
MNKPLYDIVYEIGINQALIELRDYCHTQGEVAFTEKLECHKWQEMHDAIDGIIPNASDYEIDRGDCD